MKRFRLIPSFDPRLSAELRSQRKSIVKGLLCVLATSLLTTATIPLLGKSVSAIQEAAPVSLTRREAIAKAKSEAEARVKELADKLGIDTEAERTSAVAALTSVEAAIPDSKLDGETLALSRALKEDPAKIRTALAGTNKVRGDIAAVHRLGLYALIIVGLFGLKYVFTRGQTYYLSRAAARLSADLRIRLFAKLQRLPVSYFGKKRAGAIQSVLTNDVNVYQTAVTIVRDSIDGPIKAIGAFGTIIYIQWQLALVTLLFLPIMASVIHRNGRRMKGAQRKVQDDLASVAATTTETLQGVRVIRAFAAEERIQSMYAGLVEGGFQSQLSATRVQSRLRPLVELLGAAALAAVLYVCGWLSYRGDLKLGQIAALIYALDVINQGVRNLSSVANTYSQVQAASDRIHREILDEPEPADDAKGSVLPSPQGKIEFQNVTFRYPDGTEALRNVSFTLEPGTSLALVGPSGAGKSTIADLLLRFYDPTDGRILFDGVDLRELDVKWLRNQIGVVPQQTFLFAGTIAENIRMGAPNAPDEAVQEAAKLAHADEFVSTLPARYDSPLGEGGAGLSGGQRQRVAIARALVREPALLLLDEATSALDAESERAVTEALDEVMQQRTTLFIAHRLTTAARADRILVMSRGEAIESGSHAELLAANGFYAALFKAFSGGVL
ncbi:ABC transporter ATP-binding protein [bacterium]|nr:MAG: ABC transporter ATP-binding protein [bacterium]